jgi:hypothetical protein
MIIKNLANNIKSLNRGLNSVTNQDSNESSVPEKTNTNSLEKIQREVLTNFHSSIEFDKINSDKSPSEKVPQSVKNMTDFLKNYQPEMYEGNKEELEALRNGALNDLPKELRDKVYAKIDESFANPPKGAMESGFRDQNWFNKALLGATVGIKAVNLSRNIKALNTSAFSEGNRNYVNETTKLTNSMADFIDIVAILVTDYDSPEAQDMVDAAETLRKNGNYTDAIAERFLEYKNSGSNNSVSFGNTAFDVLESAAEIKIPDRFRQGLVSILPNF